ncbi:MAG: InlB B-repeat-containing protein [Erysipelotrichaceae bacterium]
MEKDNGKKVKNWGTGGGMYRGVKASVKTLNRIIVVLMILLVCVVLYLSKTGSYSATFDTFGGDKIESNHYQYGDKIQVEKPSKTGYIFAGWYQDPDLNKKWNLKKDIIKESVTLYAKWRPSSIHILLDVAGGELQNPINEINILFHDPYGELPIPTKTGSIFVGWMFNNEFIKKDTLVLMNGEHTLKAIYK